MLGKSLTISVLIGMFCSVAMAQQPMCRQYTTRQGLPANEVYEAIQDRRGFMWFATSSGVCKYDGQTFKNFNIENGLGENTALGISEDHHGRIWCRGISGNLSYIENDSAITLEAQVKNYYPNSLFVDENNVVWVGSQTKGISYSIKPPYTSMDVTQYADSSTDIRIVRSENGLIYTRNTALNKRSMISDVHSGTEASFVMPPSSSGTRVVHHQNTTIICAGNIIYKIDKNLKMENYQMPFLTKNAYVDRHDNIWLCLDAGNGVALFKHGMLENTPEIFFANSTISSVLQDNEGSYWFTSTGSGVKYVPSLEIIEYDLQVANDGENIHFLPAENCLVASSLTGKFYTIKGEEHFISPEDNYLKNAQHLPAGLSVTFKNKKHFEHVGSNTFLVSPSPDFHFLLENKALLPERTGGYYWGNTTLFCFKANEKNHTITDTYTAPSRINASCAPGDSVLLLACNDGLWTFNRGIYHELSDRHPKLKHRINDIKSDDNGRLWIASSRNGVFILEQDSLIQIDRTNGLASNICYNIALNDDGAYIATNNGLSFIRAVGLWQYQCTKVSLNSNLPSTPIKKIFKAGSGFHLLTDDRLIWFEDKEYERKDSAPETYISHVSVNNQHIADYQNLQLDYHQNDILISVVGLSYIQPERNHYKYKLADIDTGWHYSSTPQIQYPALPPGDYKLTVYAINALDVVSTSPAEFSFVINKPYWKTWWFVLILTFIFASLIGLVIFARVERIRKTAEEKEKQSAQLARIEMKALRAQMNPHFIFNCINSIQHYILENDKLVANKLLSRFSKLVRNVLENSNSEWISVGRELETLELYIEMETLRFQSKFVANITIAPGIDPLLDQIPPLAIQPFVENAIIHGLLPLENRPGQLSIHLTKENNFIICIIDDNGIGRKNAEAIKAKKNHTYQSLGISITKERLQIYNQSGKNNRNMSLTIEDKIADDLTPSGTTIRLMLPCQSILA